jgi:hypothetical protein
MDVSVKARKVLEVMAEEYEKNPVTRIEGIPMLVVGAKAGLYLNNPMYEVAELQDVGFVRKLGLHRVILTQDGYNYIRPPIRRSLTLLKRTPASNRQYRRYHNRNSNWDYHTTEVARI